MSQILYAHLYRELLNILKKMGIELPCSLILKDYSKCYFGRANPLKNYIILYVFKDKNLTRTYSLDELTKTLLHEYCHIVQHNDPKYVRRKGVMHDTEFWEMYNFYIAKAEKFITEEKERLLDEICKADC